MAENTFRPPWYHMNIMSEFMGLIYGVYDAKPQGFTPGGISLHNMMLPHGPDREAFDHASNGELKPVKLTGTMAFMFETRFPQRVTAHAANSATLQDDYADCWKGLEKRFDPEQAVIFTCPLHDEQPLGSLRMFADAHLSVLLVLLVAVAGPLLAELPVGFRVPAVVLEVVLGIIIGPQVLGLVHFDGIVASMFAFGMAATLFMAGMELEFERIRGRPLWLAAGGWGISVALGLSVAGVLHASSLHDPMMVALALATTALGTLLPILRDADQLDTPFGRLFIAAGTMGELGPIVAMSLLLSKQYTTLQEFGFLMVFLVVVILAAAISLGLRPPRVLALLGRSMHASSQLPVRVTLLLFAAFFVLSERFGFESILGAFAAGLVVGLATQGAEGKAPR